MIERILRSRKKNIGDFDVRRVLPSGQRQRVGPFIFFDHFGPVDFAPGKGIEVRPHPHINLATITYLFDGEIMHRDSLGEVQAIRPGDVNWMTAGRGIVHSERTRPELKQQGFHMHGIQSWIALPTEHEEVEPAFFHHPKSALPDVERDGVTMKLICGRAYGAESPVATFSPMFYVDATAPAGSQFAMPDEHEDRALYVASGSIRIGSEVADEGAMVIFDAGESVTIEATADTRLMLLGGQPLPGERHLWWNFVSSNPARIEQAKADWKAGRFPAVPGDEEFIPLPED